MNRQVHQEHQGVFQEPSSQLDYIAKNIVDAAFQVHKTIGPGLLENAYEIFLLEELKERGVETKRQSPLSVQYKNKTIDMAYRLDLVIEDQILIELKSVDKILPIHHAQIMTYLKLSKFKLGFLINFNSCLIKDGIKRFAL